VAYRAALNNSALYQHAAMQHLSRAWQRHVVPLTVTMRRTHKYGVYHWCSAARADVIHTGWLLPFTCFLLLPLVRVCLLAALSSIDSKLCYTM
jgi:hypothetical protein